MIWEPMLSEFSAFSALLFFTLYALICCILCKKVGWHTLHAFGIGIGLLILRCLLPFEIPGVELIKIGGRYADFYLWLNPPLGEGITPLAILIIAWVVGSILLLLRLGFRLYRQRNEIRKHTINTSDCVFQIYRDTLQEMTCSTVGSISVSADYHSPMMVGFFKPHILFPEDMASLCDEDLRLVFRHEIIHFKNRDLWIKLLIELLCCALWWNPIVYLLRVCISQLLELRCDSQVCKNLNQEQQSDYAKTLLNAFKIRVRYPIYVTAEYLGYPSKERLRHRFKQILYAPSQAKKRWLSVLIVTLAIFAFLSSYSVIFLPYSDPEEVGTAIDLDTSFESAFILRYPDGTLKVFIDNQMYGTIDIDQLNEEPFISMIIIDTAISAEED